MLVVKRGEIVYCEWSKNRGVWGTMAENIDNYDVFPHLIEVVSVVDFNKFWSWYTR